MLIMEITSSSSLVSLSNNGEMSKIRNSENFPTITVFPPPSNSCYLMQTILFGLGGLLIQFKTI